MALYNDLPHDERVKRLKKLTKDRLIEVLLHAEGEHEDYRERAEATIKHNKDEATEYIIGFETVNAIQQSLTTEVNELRMLTQALLDSTQDLPYWQPTRRSLEEHDRRRSNFRKSLEAISRGSQQKQAHSLKIGRNRAEQSKVQFCEPTRVGYVSSEAASKPYDNDTLHNFDIE